MYTITSLNVQDAGISEDNVASLGPVYVSSDGVRRHRPKFDYCHNTELQNLFAKSVINSLPVCLAYISRMYAFAVTSMKHIYVTIISLIATRAYNSRLRDTSAIAKFGRDKAGIFMSRQHPVAAHFQLSQPFRARSERRCEKFTFAWIWFCFRNTFSLALAICRLDYLSTLIRGFSAAFDMREVFNTDAYGSTEQPRHSLCAPKFYGFIAGVLRMPNLARLSLRDNYIDDYNGAAVWECEQLTHLDLRGNLLETLPGRVASSGTLVSCRLAANDLKCSKAAELKAMAESEHLQMLDLRGNRHMQVST